MGYRQAVRHMTLTHVCAGPNPATPVKANMRRIYKKQNYVIYETEKSGYIVQNVSIDGFAHSHIENFNTAKWLIDLSIYRQIPHHITRYLAIRLLRINNDEKYVKKIQELIDNKKNKQKYYNKRCRR